MQLNRVTTAQDRVPVRTALISVADKSGLEPFMTALWALIPDLVVYSTGGTYAALESILASGAADAHEADAGVASGAAHTIQSRLRAISSYTGQPEMQGGLVKTLDFRVYLSLLSETFNSAHQEDLRRTGAVPFDLTVCSLYPFVRTAEKPGATLEDLRTNIDIGGPTMLRASAKNYLRVLSVCNPEDYPAVLAALTDNDGCSTMAFRLAMALKVFRHTADYEGTIADSLERFASTDLESIYTIDKDEEVSR
jgi:phosphoribosylaminoimidazolecarboxamide formyltransferase / IMP cyclohydrolase